MNKLLTNRIKEDFFITLYFNISAGFEFAGLKRAYLDFNRTLKMVDKDQESRNRVQAETQNYLKRELELLIVKDIESQEKFDIEHKALCENLRNKWSELSFGQAQKWINMTLKYWLLFGNDRIQSIEKNSQYFHIPIDSYVQKGMFEEKNPKPWSKLDNYHDYFKYQLKQRQKQTGNPPLIDEFIFFNNNKSQINTTG